MGVDASEEHVEPGARPLRDAARRVTDGLGRLVGEHLDLARAELKHDLRAAARDAALVLLGFPSLVVGYALVMVAVALSLGEIFGRAESFLLVGLANVAAGLVVSIVFARRLARQDRPDLDRTARALKEDRRWLRRRMRI